MSAPRIVLAALLPLLAGAASAAGIEQHLGAREDRYAVEWGGIALGEGAIRLAPDGKGCYLFSSETRPIALVRWTYGAPREQSTFCIDDDRVVSRHFEYVNDRRQSDSFRLDFDWPRGEVKTLKNGVMTVRQLPGEVHDRFTIREAVRLWVIRHVAGDAPAEAEFVLVDDDRIKAYRFAVRGIEPIETPAGRFEALRVDRVDDTRPHYYWLVPDRGYVPVKLEQLRKGKVELRMTLIR